MLLQKAPRHVRVLALGQMEALLGELEARGSAYLEKMEFAGDPRNREKLKRGRSIPRRSLPSSSRVVERGCEEIYDGKAPGVIVTFVGPLGDGYMACHLGVEALQVRRAYAGAARFLAGVGGEGGVA